jgi:FHS family L-fucose permease-like MFS transporter
MNYKGSFSLLTSLFFMWGFITVMNDVLINTFKALFNLSAFQAGLVQFAFFGAYFVISIIYFLVGRIQGIDPINRIGYKNGMVYSLLICGIGCMLFYPAAIQVSYGLFLTALFVLASGVTLLQICANPYAAIMGSKETSSSRLNLAQGFNSLGTTVGPLLGAILIYRVFASGEATVGALGSTYLLYGFMFWAAALLVFVSKMPAFNNEEKIEDGGNILAYRHLIYGILAIFFYVGGEVAIGSYLIPLAKDPSIMGLSDETASYYLSYYWGGAMIGRLMGAVSMNEELSAAKKYSYMALIALSIFAFIYVVTGIKPDESGNFGWTAHPFADVSLYLLYIVLNFVAFYFGKGRPALTLAIFSGAVMLLLLITAFGSGAFAFWAVLSIGLFNSIMWSNIFTLAIKDLGRYTGQGSSLLIMAVVGGAIIPPLQGVLVDNIGIQYSYLLPIICYLYLLFYGLKGYKVYTPSHKAI